MPKNFTQCLMFDAHLHVRQYHMLEAVFPYSARQCYGAVIMPNTDPIIRTSDQALAYRDEIRRCLQKDFGARHFELVMTGYLTEDMDPRMVVVGFQIGAWKALKFYPKSAKHGAGTTNAHNGVSNLRNCAKTFAAMEEVGMPLLLHGERIDEVADGDETDPYDREALFIKHDLPWLRETFPRLRIVLEHITTKEAADYLHQYGDADYLCATITAHHLALDRRDTLRNGTTPMLGCKPIIKREIHKLALQKLISFGHPFIFAGTDSAPHPRNSKESGCGCADGVFTAHCAAQLYAQIFDQVDALEHLENFLSLNAAHFYGIEPGHELMTFVEDPWTQDELIKVPNDTAGAIYPFGYHPDSSKRWQFKYKLV